MAIIYTYPTKASPAADDLILISDSADSNKTKQIKVSSLPSSGAGITLTTTGTSGAATLVGTVLNIPNYATSSGLSIFDEGSGVGLNIDKLDFIGTGVSAAVDGNDNTKVNISVPGGGGAPDSPANSVQFNEAGAFGGSANLTFDNTNKNLAVTHTVDIKGDGANAGKLKLYCESTTQPHAITIEGPAHSGASPYTLKLPSPAPTSNQVLEYENSTNNLRWINTPASTAPQGDDGQYQYKNGSSFAGADNLRFDSDKIHIGKDGNTPTRGQLVMYGDGTNASDIKLYNSTNNRSVTLAQQAGATQDLTLTFPGQAPAANNKILESDSSGQLSWINTPSGDTYTLQAEVKSGTSVPLKLDAGSGTDSTVNLTEGNNITLTRNSSNQITIAASSAGGSGISPFPIYQATHSVAVGGQTIIRQSVCETAGTYSKLEYFSVGASANPVYFAIYTGTITAAGSATKRLEGYNSTSSAGINVINFSSSYNFIAGQDIVIVVSANDTLGLAGSTALLSHADICRGAAVYTSTFPSTLDGLLDGITDPVYTGVCTHIY